VGAGGGTSQGYVFVEERRFLEPVRFKTVIVNNTVFNRTADITRTHTVDKTMVNEGPRAAVIERASGHKIQAVPVRELRSREEAKVITRHPPSTSTGVKNVQAPIRTQAAPPEKRVVPAREPRQVEKPAVTKPAPPPPAARRVVPPAVPPEKRVIPAREPGQVEKPAVTRAAPPPPAARNVQPAPERNAAIQGQKEPKAVEKRPGQPAGRAVEPGKQAPPAAKPPAKQEQAASKPGQKNAPEEDHQQKDQN
jgi:hypothetical protein